jgi:hypothetical protein
VFAAFALMQLVWADRDVPRAVAAAALVYAALSIGGMLLFGREAWRENADAFAVTFGLFARTGPWHRRAVSAAAPARFGGHGALVLLLLAMVSFDGLVETPHWAAFAPWAANALLDAAPAAWQAASERDALRLVTTLGFLAFTLTLFTTYLACVAAMFKARGRSRSERWPAAETFALSLMPIALGYHVAHYLSYLLVGLQSVVLLGSAQLADAGWLRAPIGLAVDINIISARTQWAIALLAIVAGHADAVVRAHATWLARAGSARAGWVRQLPLVGLMVGYTMLSLWILAQPIVEP